MTRHTAVPSYDELLDVVAQTLRADILPGLDGRDRYQVRACVAALEVVRRELAAGAELAELDRKIFAELGVPDDAALAAEIRAGLDADRFAVVADALRRRSDAAVRVLRP